MGAITNVRVERDTDAEAQLMRVDPDVFQLYFVPRSSTSSPPACTSSSRKQSPPR